MIRTRLTLWNTVLFSLTLTLLGFLLFFTTRSNLYKGIDDDLNRRAAYLEGLWQNRPPGGPGGPGGMRRGGDRGEPPPRPPDAISAAKDLDPIQAKRLEFNATLTMPRVFPNDPNEWHRERHEPFDTASLDLSKAGKRLFTTEVIMDHRVRILSLPLYRDGKITGTAQFASNMEDADAVVARMRSIMLIILPLALLATYVLGVQLTSRALRPVRDITLAAERIEASNLSERLPLQGRDEFAQLSERFNQMLGRIETGYLSLEEAYEAQRRFVGDASHELKTPLTTIKGRVGLALMKRQTPERYEEHLAAIGRSADTMAAIIQDLLLLAKSDERELGLTVEEVPFEDLASEVLHSIPQGVERVTVSCPAGQTIRVDRKLFRQVLVNLPSNALRHTEEGKQVFLSTDGGSVTVRDEGEGIAAEHLPHLFDRFYRVDESRFRGSGGSGLGLSIVKSIVEAHGGSVGIESEPGKGTTVKIEFR